MSKYKKVRNFGIQKHTTRFRWIIGFKMPLGVVTDDSFSCIGGNDADGGSALGRDTLTFYPTNDFTIKNKIKNKK